MSYTLPFTSNNFLPINIKGSNAITGTYGGVSILNNGKTELKSDTTITRLGVNKNVNSSYQVDVNGDVNVSGQFYVNGVPISSGGGGSNVYGLINTNTTLTAASPNFIALEDQAGFSSVTLPDTSTLVLGKQYTFFLINSGYVTINTHAGQTYYNDTIPSGVSFTLTPIIQSCVFVVISTTATNPRWVLFQVEQDISTIFSLPNVWTNDNQFSLISDGAGTEINSGNIITNSVSSKLYLNPYKASDSVLSVAVSSTPYNIAFGDARTILFTGTGIVQTVVLPAVGIDNLGTIFTIIRANSNQMIIQTPSGLTFYDNDNNAVSGLTLFSNTRVVSFTAIATTGTIWAMVYSQDPNKNLVVNISSTQSISGTKTFATTNFNALPSYTGGGTPTPTSTNFITRQFADANYAGGSLIGANNVWTGTNSYNTYLPTSNLTPTTSTELVTKNFTDTTYQTLSGMTAYLTTASASATYQPLSGMTAYLTTATAASTYQTISGMTAYSKLGVANNFTAQNTFTNFLPLIAGTIATPTANNLITKQYADNNYHPLGSYATLGGANTFTAQNQFNTYLPLYSGSATPTSNNLITKNYGDTTYLTSTTANSTYARIGVANNFTAQNTFTNFLPLIAGTIATPTANNLITKTYADGEYARTGYPNTFSQIQTFNNGVYMTNTLSVDGPNQVTFSYNANVPSAIYGRYDFVANTYTNTMLNSTFTKTVGIQNGNIDAFTCINSANFQGQLPTYTGASPVYANNTFFPRSYGDSRYPQLSQQNYFSDINTFNVFPVCSAVPSLGTQLVNKTYTDGTFGRLTQTNSWSGTTNTFTNSLIANKLLPYFPLASTSYRIGLNAMLNQTSSATSNIAIGENALLGYANTPAWNQTKRNIAIGFDAGKNLYYDSGTVASDDNVIIGFNAGSNMFYSSKENILIGSNCGSSNNYIQRCVFLGHNIASTGSYFLSDSVVIGARSLTSISDKSGVICIGSGNLPLFSGNSPVCVGVGCGISALDNNKGIWIGGNCGNNVNSGLGSFFIGNACGNSLTTGGSCLFMGNDSNTTKNDMVNSFVFGYTAICGTDDTFYIGGNNLFTNITMTPVVRNRNRLCYCDTITAATLNLNFEDAENIVLSTNTTTAINLPNPSSVNNIGAKFSIVKSYTTPVLVTITASAGLTIYSSSGNTNTYSFLATEYYVTLTCINTTGTAWIVTNEDTSKQFVDLTSNQSNIQGTKTFTSTNGSQSVSTFNFENVNNNTLNFPNVNFTHTKSTAAVVGDNCGIMSFDMKNSTTGVSTRYATIGVTLNNATAGSENSIVNIVGKSAGADLNYMNLGGGISSIELPIRMNKYWIGSANPTVITGGTTLSYTGSNSFYKFNSVSAGGTAFTITLPTIDAGHLGNEVQFRRVGGTVGTVVSFIGSSSQNVYNTALVGGATAQALMSSGVYIVRLVPMVVTGTTYAWFQM